MSCTDLLDTERRAFGAVSGGSRLPRAHSQSDSLAVFRAATAPHQRKTHPGIADAGHQDIVLAEPYGHDLAFGEDGALGPRFQAATGLVRCHVPTRRLRQTPDGLEILFRIGM